MWIMRGSLSREEAWVLSIQERDEIVAFGDERMKMLEKTKLPVI